MRKLVGILLIVAGGIIILVLFKGQSSTDRIQKKMMESLESGKTATFEEIEESSETLGSYGKIMKANKRENISDIFDVEQKEPKVSEEGQEEPQEEADKIDIVCIGTLSISKIDLEVAVSEGATMENLKYSVAHYSNTAAIGEKGNCAIAGHRSYAYNEFFNRLDELEVGDEITAWDGEEKYTYKVYDKFVVEPSQTEVLDPSNQGELTLITCTPIRVATHRLIIKAKLQN